MFVIKERRKYCEDCEYLAEEARVDAWNLHTEVYRTNGTHQNAQLKFSRPRRSVAIFLICWRSGVHHWWCSFSAHDSDTLTWLIMTAKRTVETNDEVDDYLAVMSCCHL